MRGRISASPYRQANHFTFYWRLEPNERHRLNETRTAAYAAGKLLSQVMPGDVLWFVNVFAGDLYVLGRLHVATVVDNADVAQELIESDVPWQDQEWYAISNRYQVEALRELIVTPLAEQLRFVDEPTEIETPLTIYRFRGLRALTAFSARLLDEVWYRQVALPETSADYLELTEDDRAYSEGKVIIRTLQERQRSRALVQEAKQRGKKRNDLLVCEVCEFSFLATYGMEYIEAHHAEQIASFTRERQSTVEDLHLLCANCHRMVHTQTPPLSIAQLQAILTDQRKLHTTRNDA